LFDGRYHDDRRNAEKQLLGVALAKNDENANYKQMFDARNSAVTPSEKTVHVKPG
jgi:hypothetical protein